MTSNLLNPNKPFIIETRKTKLTVNLVTKLTSRQNIPNKKIHAGTKKYALSIKLLNNKSSAIGKNINFKVTPINAISAI